MKWSLRLGRFLGIDVFLHVTFLILVAIVWYTTRGEGHGKVLFMLCMFTCVVLHEYGHALMARRFGVATRDITLLPIGGVARLERMPAEPWQELLVAVAGPAVNVVIAAVLWSLSAILKVDPLHKIDRLCRRDRGH
jgi:Zn-dependent protease